MSWQAYVDSSLVGSGHIDKAAIIGVAGDSAWASSPEFQIKPEEMTALAAILSGDSGSVDKAHADGVYVAGIRYVVTRTENRSVYARQGRTGIIAVKSKQAILVGYYGEGKVAGNSAQTVESLADYLIKLGY